MKIKNNLIYCSYPWLRIMTDCDNWYVWHETERNGIPTLCFDCPGYRQIPMTNFAWIKEKETRFVVYVRTATNEVRKLRLEISEMDTFFSAKRFKLQIEFLRKTMEVFRKTIEESESDSESDDESECER